MSNNKVAEKVIAVGVVLPDQTRYVTEEHLAELQQLIDSAGGVVVYSIVAKRNAPDPATWIGSGKAEEIGGIATKTGATLIVFDDDLSPAQARNLEKITGVSVIDRSGLILDIFARRARSREARTQVELAQLEYMLPRLTRAWTHLERQAGGIGTRGVGETQLELDRRIIRNRIARLKEDLTKIERTRETQRKSRTAAYNKADRTDMFELRRKNAASVSALTGRNIDRLIGIIRERELENGEVLHLEIPHNDARVIARLHDVAEVYEQRVTDGAMLITAWIP